MKAHFFYPSEPFSIIGSLTTFQIAYETIHTHAEATMWVLAFFYHERSRNGT